MPRLVIGADDYGLSAAVSAGILELIAQGRLSATSCMTTFEEWPQAAARLRDAPQVALGVHLTLTDFAPLAPSPSLAPGGRFPSFPALARRAWTRSLDPAELRGELSRQIDRFEAALGRPPDYLDGHHHVQQLPGVREVVTELARQRLPRPWVRTCVEQPAVAWARGEGLTRALAFAALGRGLRDGLRLQGVATNDGFTGVYDFTARPDYGERFARFVSHVRDGTFLMCHPGRVDPILLARDGLTVQREAELAWLASEACGELLLSRELTLSPPQDETPSSA